MQDELLNFKSSGTITRVELKQLASPILERRLTLIIAGIDSGGGAGLTADCLSVQDNQGYPLVCPTALTVQSLKRVGTVQAVDPKIFKETLDVLIEDFPGIAAVKVGLITSKALLDITLDYLEGPLKHARVVWDPVLTATAGNFESADLKQALPRILKRADVFTPNLDEALALVGWTRELLDARGVRALGHEYVMQGAKALLVKGGHADGTYCDDILIKKNFFAKLRTQRLPGHGVHGGGCALSSACAANLASGYCAEDAVFLAKAYVLNGIDSPAINIGSDRPPCGHHHSFMRQDFMPHIIEDGFPELSSQPSPLCILHLGLYPVLPSSEWIERVLKRGVKLVQLRIKDKDRPDLLDEIKRSVALAEQYHARLFIDDHYEEAIKAGAYGVHLGMEDLRTADLKRIKDAGLHLGISTHGPYEVQKAIQLSPSYIALGHVFPTNTKEMPSLPQGIKHLRAEARMLNNRFPTVAIGGIKLDNAQVVMESGVGSIAVVTALTDCKNDAELDEAITKWLAIAGNAVRIEF